MSSICHPKLCHKWINLTEGNQDPATEEPFCLSPISYCLKEFGLEAYIREKLLLKIAFYLKNSFAWQGKYLIIKYLLFLYIAILSFEALDSIIFLLFSVEDKSYLPD